MTGINATTTATTTTTTTNIEPGNGKNYIPNTTTHTNENDTWDTDGAINEKKRFYGMDSNNDPPFSSTKTNFQPSKMTSHHLHSIIGLDRYPNYLARWSLEDISELENSMQKQLTKVQEQKRFIQWQRQLFSEFISDLVHDNDDNDDDDNNDDNDDDKEIIRKGHFQAGVHNFKSLLQPPTSWTEISDSILDPRASEVIFKSAWYTKSSSDQKRPTLEQVLNGEIDIHLDAPLLEIWMDQEMFDVYSFPLLSKEFSERIKNFIQRTIQYANTNPKWKTNSYISPGKQSIDLDTIGLGWINTLLFQLVIRPISRHLFQSSEIHGELDWRQGYVQSYAPRKVHSKHQTHKMTQKSQLVPHTDDSEVTLNLCLGNDDFVGGNVKFSGLRGTRNEGKVLGEFEPIVGTALLHAGRHLHEVTEVMEGDRYAYVIWSRSWGGVRSSTCPCCWINRRTGVTAAANNRNGNQDGRNECICSPQWN